MAILEGRHSFQRFGDPGEFVRWLVAGGVYTAALPNDQDAVFLAAGLANLLTTLGLGRFTGDYAMLVGMELGTENPAQTFRCSLSPDQVTRLIDRLSELRDEIQATSSE